MQDNNLPCEVSTSGSILAACLCVLRGLTTNIFSTLPMPLPNMVPSWSPTPAKRKPNRGIPSNAYTMQKILPPSVWGEMLPKPAQRKKEPEINHHVMQRWCTWAHACVCPTDGGDDGPGEEECWTQVPETAVVGKCSCRVYSWTDRRNDLLQGRKDQQTLLFTLEPQKPVLKNLTEKKNQC